MKRADDIQCVKLPVLFPPRSPARERFQGRKCDMWIPVRLGLLSPSLPWRKGSSKRSQRVSWLALRRERMTKLLVPDGANSRRARRCSRGKRVGQGLRVSRRAASSLPWCPCRGWSCGRREVEAAKGGHGLRFCENEVVVQASSTIWLAPVRSADSQLVPRTWVPAPGTGKKNKLERLAGLPEALSLPRPA